jgi:hypothetical protein
MTARGTEDAMGTTVRIRHKEYDATVDCDGHVTEVRVKIPHFVGHHFRRLRDDSKIRAKVVAEVFKMQGAPKE